MHIPSCRLAYQLLVIDGDQRQVCESKTPPETSRIGAGTTHSGGWRISLGSRRLYQAFFLGS